MKRVKNKQEVGRELNRHTAPMIKKRKAIKRRGNEKQLDGGG